MRLKRIETAIIAVSILLAGCTQKQQETISSSDWQRNINSSLENISKKAQVKLEHTGNWLSTETDLSNLQASISRAIDKDSVTDAQATSLRKSVDYIRQLQKRSISSGQGINKSEKAQITAAIKRVENRLKGWIAKAPQKSM